MRHVAKAASASSRAPSRGVRLEQTQCFRSCADVLLAIYSYHYCLAWSLHVSLCHDFLLIVASIFSMLQPRHNLLPLCTYRKQGGKCKGVDTNPTHDRCCQDLEVLVLLLLTSSSHSRLQPLQVAQPGKSNLSQPSAARADSHRPWHQTTPHINTNIFFLLGDFPGTVMSMTKSCDAHRWS